MEERKCEHCKTRFVPKTTTRAGRFCSAACYHAFGHRGNRKDEVKGQRMTLATGHPISPPSGITAVSRIVLYDKIGPGPHACHWCGTSVDWMPGRGPAEPGNLIADHLDWDRQNDTPENLVPSCNVCNAHRTRGNDRNRIRPGEPVLMMNGRPTRAIERACDRCGESFLALPAHVRKGKARFCSRACMYARNR